MRYGKRKFEHDRSRVYAIGDVHGRLDLFKRLIRLIKQDNENRSPVPTSIILLGNMVDHGPDSAPLVHYCKSLSEDVEGFEVLKGDHEAMMVAALRTGDATVTERWLSHGGMVTLASWGMPRHLMECPDSSRFSAAARRLIGEDVLSWMENLPLSRKNGNHFFVHAGIRPGVELHEQEENDLLQVGEEFLESKADHGAVIVHGHSPREAGPDLRANRIGVDSAAFRTGRLSAVGLENGLAWPLMTEPDAAETERAAVKSNMERLIAGWRHYDQEQAR